MNIIAVIAGTFLLLSHPLGNALEFLEIETTDYGNVLIAQDCSPSRERACKQNQTQVAPGDSATLDRILQQQKHSEVWLNSGGGNSAEGQLIGRVLRKHGMAVRIKSGHRCASACTVAFLGGVIRTVEDGAQYLVHSRSAVLHAVPQEKLRKIISQPAGELEREFMNQREIARDLVVDRLSYLQSMIGGSPSPEGYRRLHRLGLERRSPYLDSKEFQEDVTRVRIEGQAAVHAIVMRYEQDTVSEALELAAANLSTLGSRADKAHRMMDVMFTTSILRTSDLTPDVLYKLGFVTPILRR